MTTEIMGDQISLPVIREMSSIDHFQAAILGASWIQSMQNARHTKDRRIGRPRNDVIDSLAPGTIGHKRLSPAIKSVTPSVDPATSENIEFHRFWTEPPDSPGIQSANAEGGLDMAVNVDRLIHVELAIHPPAKRVQDVVGVFGTEPAQHNPRLIGFAVAVGILEMQQFGAVRHIDPAIPRFDPGGNQQSFGKDRGFVRDSIAVGIFQNQNLIRRLLSRCNLRINLGSGNPEPALGIKIHLNRLMNPRICREQVDFEPFRQHKRFPFFFGIRNRNLFQFPLGECGRAERHRQNEDPTGTRPP